MAVNNAGRPGRPGARKSNKKGATKGSGGKGRRSLAGKGATPSAEDIQAHLAEIEDQTAYLVPTSTTDEIVALNERFTS